MPHLIVKDFKDIKTPLEEDGVMFEFTAKNEIYDNEKLIKASVEDDEFFLVVKEEKDKTIIKADKTTRPSATYKIHKALLALKKAAGIEVLSSNVPQNYKNPHLNRLDALKDIGFFAKSFPTDKKVHIEVGFGSGRHLLYQAKQNKDKLFIGIEIHRPSIEQVIKQINIQGITNILVVDYDARLFLEQTPSNIVEKIYVHFPVPWDKKPHRRVISTEFVKEAQRVLCIGGELELRTDSENYYNYSYETFIGFKSIEITIRKNKDIAVTSKYEDRWKRMDKNIYDIIMKNDISSPPLKIEGGFDFSNKDIKRETVMSLHRKKIVGDGYFVHFERVYRLSNGGIMLKVSFGSFDRPEHMYIIINEKDIKYFPHLPLLSKTNLKAHQKISEVIYG